MVTARDWLVAQIRDVVKAAGDDVQVVAYETAGDVPRKLRVTVKQSGVVPEPAAPRGALRVNYTLGIESPMTDPAKAEPQLDAFVPGFLADLWGITRFTWTEARKRDYQQSTFGYDVTCYVIAGIEGKV